MASFVSFDRLLAAPIDSLGRAQGRITNSPADDLAYGLEPRGEGRVAPVYLRCRLPPSAGSSSLRVPIPALCGPRGLSVERARVEHSVRIVRTVVDGSGGSAESTVLLGAAAGRRRAGDPDPTIEVTTTVERRPPSEGILRLLDRLAAVRMPSEAP